MEYLYPSGKYTFSTPEEPVDKCAVVRAIAVGSDGKVSPIETGVYFIGLDSRKYDDMAVLSVASDPEGLFGYEKGIYVAGKTARDAMERDGKKKMNFWSEAGYTMRGREWEREAAIAFFDEDHYRKADQQAGIRIKGNWSRSFPQKSLNIYARDFYSDSDTFGVSFFDNPVPESSITVFYGGNNFAYKIQDVVSHALAEGLNIASMKFRPCVMFLNGEYWGFCFLTEKYSKEFISEKYGVDPRDIVMIKENKVEIGEEADDELYQQFRYLVYRGFASDEEYESFKMCVDMDSLLDNYAFRLYIGNQNDWPARNFALWRSRTQGGKGYADGRWRYMIYDLNNTCMREDLQQEGSDTIQEAMDVDGVLSALMENSRFREELGERLAYMAEVTAESGRVNALLDSLEETMTEPMGEYYEVYLGSSLNRDDFIEYCESVKRFFAERPEHMRALMEKHDLVWRDWREE